MKVPILPLFPQFARATISVLDSLLPSKKTENTPAGPAKIKNSIEGPYFLAHSSERLLKNLKWIAIREKSLVDAGHAFVGFWNQVERSAYLRQKRAEKIRTKKVSAKEVFPSAEGTFLLWKALPRKGPQPQARTVGPVKPVAQIARRKPVRGRPAGPVKAVQQPVSDAVDRVQEVLPDVLKGVELSYVEGVRPSNIPDPAAPTPQKRVRKKYPKKKKDS